MSHLQSGRIGYEERSKGWSKVARCEKSLKHIKWNHSYTTMQCEYIIIERLNQEMGKHMACCHTNDSIRGNT